MGDFSREFCGGTHVANTSNIMLFKIVSESGVAAGVRRIEALTGRGVLKYYASLENEVKEAAKAAKTEPVAETKAEDAGSAPAGQIVDIVKTETGESVMNDSELVAVITAAVAAASAGQNAYTTYPSKDKLVTRPIRRIKR